MLKKEYLKDKATCKVTFTLPAEIIEGVSEVQILGDFNNWNLEQGAKMKSAKKGFETTLELAAGRQYEFRYLLDGNVWANDPAADDYHATPYGVHNSVVKLDEVAVAAPVAKATAPKSTTAKTAAAKAPAAKTAAKTTAPKAPATKAAPVAAKTPAPAKTTAKAAPKKTK